MVEVEVSYSKVQGYAVAKDSVKHYLIDLDGDKFSNLIIFPHKLSQDAFEINEKDYNFLKKDVTTLGGITELVGLNAAVLPISAFISNTLLNFQGLVKQSIYYVALLASVLLIFLFFLISKKISRNKWKLIFSNSTVGSKIRIKCLTKQQYSKVVVNNALIIILFLVLPTAFAIFNQSLLSFLVLSAAVSVLIYQHRVFFIRAKSFGIKFEII